VSNASEDLPEPDGPVTTVSFPTGIEQETFRRLCVRARTIRRKGRGTPGF